MRRVTRMRRVSALPRRAAGYARADGDPGAPAIRLTGLGKTYPGPVEVPALKPVDLVVERGEYLAVVGPSGSGKSTLLNLLGLLDRPTSGEYLLSGVDVGTLGERERTAIRGQRIGFVFQAFQLLPHRTAVENVALAHLYTGWSQERRIQAAVTALRRVGLGHRLSAFPPTLSGGERQRVAVARALVKEPQLMLCDEPTGNLDSPTASEVISLFEELNAEGQTIVVITHDPAVADRANRTVRILDGRLG